MSDVIYDEYYGLGYEEKKLLAKAHRKGFLSKAFAVAATATVAGAVVYGIGTIPEPMTASLPLLGMKIWVAGFLTSTFSFMLDSFPYAKVKAVKDVEMLQVAKYENESLDRLRQEQETFLKNLHSSGKRSLTDGDYAVLATLSEDDLSELPQWVPAAGIAAERKAYDDGSASQTLEDFVRERARAIAQKHVEHPSSYDTLNNNLGLVMTSVIFGIAPLALIWEAFTWKEPEASDFTLPTQEKPDLAKLVQELKKQQSPPAII